jgi:hypothetical protein
VNEPRDTTNPARSRRQCFVAMPITTPPTSFSAYGNDDEHFSHVLAHLFEPAIERTGMTALPPLTTGSNLVHAAIIDKIVQSELVLCDMSGLNPNVFFEMGLRTALNKPLCFVVDDVTASHIPFDAGIVSYHVYRSALAPWTLEEEIAALAKHISASVAQSKNGNALWRYFGLRAQFGTEAHSPSSAGGDKLEYLTMEVEGMRRKLDGMLGALAPQAGDTRTRVALPAAGEISEDDLIGTLHAIDPTTLTNEQLALLTKQLRGRLRRARTRTEEAAIERSLELIEGTLETRQNSPG